MKWNFFTATLLLAALTLGVAPTARAADGTALWTNIFNGAGNGNAIASALALDSSGNVLVTGYATGSESIYDYATIKYSGAGVPLWTNLFNGSGNNDDEPNALAVDGGGDVFVTGASYSGSGSGYDYATIKYSGAGVPLWTNLFNGTANNNDSANALAVDGSGNVYVTGSTAANGYGDYVTIKYSGAVLSVTNLTSSGWGFANQQFHFTLTGPAGSNAVISASTNLQNWIPLATNPLTLGTLTFTDAVATNFPRRFYRATLQP